MMKTITLDALLLIMVLLAGAAMPSNAQSVCHVTTMPNLLPSTTPGGGRCNAVGNDFAGLDFDTVKVTHMAPSPPPDQKTKAVLTYYKLELLKDSVLIYVDEIIVNGVEQQIVNQNTGNTFSREDPNVPGGNQVDYEHHLESGVFTLQIFKNFNEDSVETQVGSGIQYQMNAFNGIGTGSGGIQIRRFVNGVQNTLVECNIGPAPTFQTTVIDASACPPAPTPVPTMATPPPTIATPMPSGKKDGAKGKRGRR